MNGLKKLVNHLKKLFFKIRHNSESNLVDHEIEKISTYSNKLINQKNISFSVNKK